MPIDESVTRCVAFVKDERTNQRVGTAFFVVFDGAHGYAVTAGHVAQVLNEPSVLLDVRNVGGELETVRLTSEWRFGEPSDLAVAEVGDEGLDLVGWPMEKTTDELDAIPTLGSTVFYVDGVAVVKTVEVSADGGVLVTLAGERLEDSLTDWMIPRGSVALAGISLTLAHLEAFPPLSFGGASIAGP